MSTVSTFSNPMLAADPLSVVDGGDDAGEGGDGRSSPVLGVVPASDTVKETIASLHQVRAGLGAEAGVATHLVADAGNAAVEREEALGENDATADPFAPEVEQESAKSKAKFKAFVRDTMIERIVFGKRDPQAERAMVHAIWTGDAFDPRKKISHPGGLWTGLLYPESQYRLVYDFGQLFAVIYTAIIVPIRLAFDMTPEVWSTEFWVDVVIDSFFLFDMFLNFFAYHRNEHTGTLVTDRAVIRRDYLTGFFWIDVVACNPADYILMAVGQAHAGEEARNMRLLRMMRISRMIRLARILRLLRASRLASVHDFIHNKIVSMPAMNLLWKMIMLWGLILSVSHLLGCLWLHWGIVHAGVPPHGSWIDHRNWYLNDTGCEATLSMDIGAGEDQYDVLGEPDEDGMFHVYEECLDTERITKFHMYIESLYFSVVTMTSVGYGDITPRSSREKVYTVIMMITGGFVWAIVIAIFSDTLAGITEHDRQYENKLRRVHSLLGFLGAKKQLKQNVTKFYQYRFKKRRFFDDRMFNELPPRLRREMVALRYSEALFKVPLFRTCNDETLIQICNCMQSFSAWEGEIIVEEGDTDRDLFILEKGRCEAFVGTATEPVEFLSEGSFFGEMSFFGLRVKRSATIVAGNYSELSWLSYADFTAVLEGDVSLRRRMHDFALLRMAVYEMETHKTAMKKLDAEVDNITCVDEAQETETAKLMREEIERVYSKIQAHSDGSEGEGGAQFALSEAEQTRVRLHQVRKTPHPSSAGSMPNVDTPSPVRWRTRLSRCTRFSTRWATRSASTKSSSRSTSRRRSSPATATSRTSWAGSDTLFARPNEYGNDNDSQATFSRRCAARTARLRRLARRAEARPASHTRQSRRSAADRPPVPPTPPPAGSAPRAAGLAPEPSPPAAQGAASVPPMQRRAPCTSCRQRRLRRLSTAAPTRSPGAGDAGQQQRCWRRPPLLRMRSCGRTRGPAAGSHSRARTLLRRQPRWRAGRCAPQQRARSPPTRTG